MTNSLWPRRLQCSRLPCPSPFPIVCSDSCPLSWWDHSTILSAIATSFYSQNFPASGYFSWAHSSHHVAKVLNFNFSTSPSNKYSRLISFRKTGWISLQSKELLRLFSSTTVQKHQFLGVQPSLCSNFHIYTWILEKS